MSIQELLGGIIGVYAASIILAVLSYYKAI